MAGVWLWYVYLLEEIGEMVLMESVGLHDRRMRAWWVVDVYLDIMQQWNISRTLDTRYPSIITTISLLGQQSFIL
jgi:hypothetical protein